MGPWGAHRTARMGKRGRSYLDNTPLTNEEASNWVNTNKTPPKLSHNDYREVNHGMEHHISDGPLYPQWLLNTIQREVALQNLNELLDKK